MSVALQAALSSGAIFVLAFVAIWAFWFVERLRGNSAPKARDLTGDIVGRRSRA
ncbi:hypothetical protein [Afipia clevelandensis]|uniref:Uncharacterized protein n=1 Tax=Afipia clevelandensis ATCC 49720 TaxID=883079 RepID=K8PD49_9BRAD|nr:hypothetical protein [Afipia clevelandensis]EKS38659.1 hypothetical protein HMPREF9696_01128 [Afipia clevelandensis ATCC 49720]